MDFVATRPLKKLDWVFDFLVYRAAGDSPKYFALARLFMPEADDDALPSWSTRSTGSSNRLSPTSSSSGSNPRMGMVAGTPGCSGKS